MGSNLWNFIFWPLGPAQGWGRWFFYRSHPGLGLVPKNNLRLEFSVAQFAICDIYCLRKIFSAALVCYFGIRHLAIAAQHRRRQLSPTMKVRWEKILDRCALWNLKIAVLDVRKHDLLYLLDWKNNFAKFLLGQSRVPVLCWFGKSSPRAPSWFFASAICCLFWLGKNSFIRFLLGKNPGPQYFLVWQNMSNNFFSSRPLCAVWKFVIHSQKYDFGEKNLLRLLGVEIRSDTWAIRKKNLPGSGRY